jgi:hypothetical protein
VHTHGITSDTHHYTHHNDQQLAKGLKSCVVAAAVEEEEQVIDTEPKEVRLPLLGCTYMYPNGVGINRT